MPREVVRVLREEGITELYPPQAQAVPHALEGRNVVLSIPTASGKSLVAYLAAIRHVLERGGKVLYIVPLRALAQEKYEDLRRFEPLGIRTVRSVGDFDSPDPRLEEFDIIVATSEKADSLLRHRSQWLSSLSLVVADEVHLIHDPGRGPTLEVTLTKLRRFNPSLQIIALSATISNSVDLAEWLDAEHVASEWRPVLLKEGVFLDGRIFFTDNTSREVEVTDDPVWSLIKDSVEGGGQCLVFVNTRRSTESLATRFASAMDDLLERRVEVEEVEGEETSVGKRLRSCVSKGIAFHNAGLTNDQRRMVEEAFKRGDIRCIVATPTLAAGINLPARRVVIRDVQRFEGGYGRVAIPVLEIKQMCGRAGRPRYDSEGEAVLVAKGDREKDFLMDNYLLGETEEIFSKLGSEPVLRSHVLAIIATGTADSRESLLEFMGSTFFAHQTEVYHLEDSIDRVLDFLEGEGMIRKGEELRASFFGRRVSDLYIDPMSAVSLRDALRTMGEVPTLGVLHALCSAPDMLSMYLRRGDHEWVEEVLMTRGEELLLPVPEDLTEYEFFLSDLKTALSLEAWMEEIEEDSLLKRFNMGPGDLRNKVEVGEWLLYSMRELASIFNKNAYPPLTELMYRIRYGVKGELMDLVKLRHLGRVRARALFDRGFRGPQELKEADVDALSRIPGIGEGMARRIKEQVGGELHPPGAKAPEPEEQEGQLRLTDF
ncbi:MAG: DEAD/DEAH box helicase [Methanomassiliicoccales archaeon]